MTVRKDMVKRLYKEAIFTIFGHEDPDPVFEEDNKILKEAIEKDVHYGDVAPGGWNPGSTLEIYCESGIPNATDYFDPVDFGFTGSAVYNSCKWRLVDDIVNLYLEAAGHDERFFHEPYNNAVVSIWKAQRA